MNEVLSRGDAEGAPVAAQEEGVKWYIPHHGINHPKKNKIRVYLIVQQNSKELLRTTTYSVDSTLPTIWWEYYAGLEDTLLHYL